MKLNRRDLLKAGACGLVFGTLPVAITAAPRPIVLERFCGWTSRFATEFPWVSGGYKYATDSYICVRMKSAMADSVQGEKPFPNILSAVSWDEFNAVADWQPWPALSLVDGIESCTDCDGEGLLCDKCVYGAVIRRCLQPVADLHINEEYDTSIRALPNVVFTVGEYPADHERHQASGEIVMFKFDGGEGAVLPVDIRDHEQQMARIRAQMLEHAHG